MSKKTAVSFVYKSKTYYALIRTTTVNGVKHHRVRLMNGGLEGKLDGSHVFVEESIAEQSADKATLHTEDLTQCVTKALARHFEITK